MGTKLGKESFVAKEGVLYDDIKDTLRSLDLLLFCGGDFVSSFIRYLENKHLEDHSQGITARNDLFSHVGIVVKSDVLDDERLEKDKIYIWESTMSGNLGDGICDISGKSFLGVQLRDFEKVVDAYDEPPSTKIAVAYLKLNIDRNKIKPKFTKLFRELNGKRYDANIISLLSSINSNFRCMRGFAEKLFGTGEWLFCSELVAMIYKELEIMPMTINPKDVVPMDFLGYDTDDDEKKVPVITESPIYIVSKQHYNEYHNE